MYFRLEFFPKRSDLLAVVASDGNVYWNGYDVGQFLGYCNAYQFARRYAKRNLDSLIPFQRKKGCFFTFEEMLDIMKSVRNSLKDIDKFITLFSNGLVEPSTDLNLFLTDRLDPKQCPRLIVSEDKGSIRLQDWMKQYVNSRTEYYNELKKRIGYAFLDIQLENVISSPLAMQTDAPCNHQEEPLNLTINDESIADAEPPSVNVIDSPPVIHMEEENNAPETVSNNNVTITDGVFQILFDGMQVPEEILLNINGQLYAYVKAFTHLKESW